MPEWKQIIRERLAGLGLDPAREAEIVEELADHVGDRYEELRAGGLTEEEARRAALAELSDSDLLELRRTEDRESEPLPAGGGGAGSALADVWRDLRYGGRALRKSPGFTAVVVLTMALGIGANATVFTLINALFLNPLRLENSSELVAVYTTDARNRAAGSLLPTSYLNLEDLRQRNQVLSGLAGYSAPVALGFSNGATAPERVFAELATGNYFETLGVQPAIGRFFLPEEDRTPGSHPVAVLSYGAWQRRFGGARDVLGRTMRLNSVVFTIIGVAPEGFNGVNAIFGPDLWIPSMMAEQILPVEGREWLRDRGVPAFRGAGRLKRGVTMAQAEANLKTVAGALAMEYPEADKGRSVAVRPLAEATFYGDARRSALFGSAVLMAIVGVVLLIACSNVANLLLARAAGRRQEMAVRLALGAGRRRLIRQLLTESVLLGLLSGAAGLALAYKGCGVLWSLLRAASPAAQNLIEPRLDGNVFLFALVVSVATGLIFGLAPAIDSSRVDIVERLKEETRSAGRSRRRIRLGKALLVGQVALSLVSLTTAGLFLRSIERAYRIDPGFETKRLAVLLISPGQAGLDQQHSEQYYRDVRARISGIPGVRSVSWAANLPLFGHSYRSVEIEGEEAREKSNARMAFVNTVDVDYFATAGIPILRGRDFTTSDRAEAVPVAVINETMAAKYWPEEDALGKRFQLSGDKVLRQVVGIAKTAKYQTLGEAPEPCVYVPLAQNFADSMVLYVRTEGDPAGVLNAVQGEARNVDSRVAVDDVRTVGTVIDQSLWGAKMGVALLSVFGALALGLASIGLYGMMSYSVNLRKPEIGVRMAMGAAQGSVLRMVLRQGMTLVAIGMALGVGASLLAGSALSSLLYGVNPADAISIGGASLALALVAMLACYLPARRASRLDPVTALRES